MTWNEGVTGEGLGSLGGGGGGSEGIQRGVALVRSLDPLWYCSSSWPGREKKMLPSDERVAGPGSSVS